mgnify:CR=1 FL=1
MAVTLSFLLLAALIFLYLHDRRQKTHTILRNYPLMGHFRYIFERLGVYFRQYLYANDREERPFDRLTRSWVYRAAKGLSDTIAFGTAQDLQVPGTVIFVNALYPTLEEERSEAPPLSIGTPPGPTYFAKRLVNISGMSFGALSGRAIEALSLGARQSGSWLNTGEGGLSPYHLAGGCDLIFQIGTAKYGARDEKGRLCDKRLRELSTCAKAFEIKLAQGAKPGKGGILPGNKVTPEVARIRGIPPWLDSLSPNRHPEIKTHEDLLQMVGRVREVTEKPVGVKLVLSKKEDIEGLCDAILKKGAAFAPDFITLDGGDGGSGAAPESLADHVGMPLAESLPWLVDALAQAGLNDRVRVIASGKLLTAQAAAWALCVGADFVNTARGFLFALGCVQSLRCHTGTCPTGITTHDPRRTQGLVVEDKAMRVAHYALAMNRELDVIAHACGLANARGFSREHARLVLAPGKSALLSEIYPPPELAAKGTRKRVYTRKDKRKEEEASET